MTEVIRASPTLAAGLGRCAKLSCQASPGTSSCSAKAFSNQGRTLSNSCSAMRPPGQAVDVGEVQAYMPTSIGGRSHSFRVNPQTVEQLPYLHCLLGVLARLGRVKVRLLLPPSLTRWRYGRRRRKL